MRIVHARKRCWEKDAAFENKFVLLVWALSAIKWKELGHTTVMYTDNKTLEDMKKFGLDKLYDEINTDLFENGAICENIDFEYFWAMPKIISLHYETYHLGNNVLVSDQDVVPTSDFSRLFNAADVLVWSNKEYVEDRRSYPRLDKLSLPKGYQLPNWYTGKIKPLNTGLIYFRDKTNAIEYCNEVFKYVQGNKNEYGNSKAVTMCNAEQRMMGEWLHHKGYTYMTVQPANEGLFNKNAFHTHGYKNHIKNENGLEWNVKFLNMIRESALWYYNLLIGMDIFKEEKEKMFKSQ